MSALRRTKIIRENDLVAEVDVEVTDQNEPWGPYLSVQEAQKLDAVRLALRNGDLKGAARMGRVYRLTPIAG
jgi:hypothetical protein